MKCDDCKEIKDKPMTYTKCKKCDNWREMNSAEKAVAAKPFRFDGSGQPTRSY